MNLWYLRGLKLEEQEVRSKWFGVVGLVDLEELEELEEHEDHVELEELEQVGKVVRKWYFVGMASAGSGWLGWAGRKGVVAWGTGHTGVTTKGSKEHQVEVELGEVVEVKVAMVLDKETTVSLDVVGTRAQAQMRK